jgi:DNA-binding helix-hairpin-helix protein with protein kinase domain
MIGNDLERRQEECNQIQSEYDELVSQLEEISKKKETVVQETSSTKKLDEYFGVEIRVK